MVVYRTCVQIFSNNESICTRKGLSSADVFSGSRLHDIRIALEQHGWTMVNKTTFTKDNYRIELNATPITNFSDSVFTGDIVTNLADALMCYQIEEVREELDLQIAKL